MFRKMYWFRKIYGCSWLLISMFVVACSNESTTTQLEADKSPIVEQSQATLKHSTDHYKTHHGKPGAEVSLRENIVHRLEPGVDADVTLELVASYSEGDMTVTLAGSDGLHVVAGETHYTFSLGETGHYSMPLRLLAAEAGRYYIHMQVAVNHQGRQTMRALSAIVQVGPEAPSDSRQKAGSAGDVIPLPAQETIIQQ